ncbi:MAG: DNA/RNA helicase domain-containing protein, partial [Sphingomonadaceae bacterium]
MARAWWQGTAAALAAAEPDMVLGSLARHSPFASDPAQVAAWRYTIAHLAALGLELPEAYLFLEFAIPRMGRRADAVLVAGGLVFVLEYKVGARAETRSAMAQVHGYALDLKSFHATSHDRPIIPLLVATHAPAQSIGLGFAHDGVHAPMLLSAGDVLPAIRQLLATSEREAMDAVAWAEGAYRPTPTIIEAAQALFGGHRVEEISRSEAGVENLTTTAEAVGRIVERAHAEGRKAICFLTGVPGAGKTLAGLNLAVSRLGGREDATFLSGNGPLVAVLREALKRDFRARTSRTTPGAATTARSPDKLIQNVHHFRDEYAGNAHLPSEHVVVFDEAQRAWNREQTARFMREKRGLADFDQSEPAFLLSVMDR